jgi:hypothetical protein
MMTVRMTTRRRGFAIVWLSLAVALLCSKSVPATAEDLYRAQTVVTGQGEANRTIGFASCMENVLIKVSGAQQLNGTSTITAGATGGSFAASPLTKPFGAASAAPRRCCRTTVNRRAGHNIDRAGGDGRRCWGNKSST